MKNYTTNCADPLKPMTKAELEKAIDLLLWELFVKEYLPRPQTAVAQFSGKNLFTITPMPYIPTYDA